MMSADKDEQHVPVLEFQQSQYSMRINKFRAHITEAVVWQGIKWYSSNRISRYIAPQRNDAFRCVPKMFMKRNANFNLLKSRVVGYLRADREKYEQRITLVLNYDQNVAPIRKLSLLLAQLVLTNQQPLFQAVAGRAGDGQHFQEIEDLEPEERETYAYGSLYSEVFGFPEAVKDAERARDDKRAGMLDHPFDPIHPLDFPRQMIGCLDPRQYRLPVFARLKNGRRLRGFGSTLYETNETHIEYSEEPHCSQYQANGVEPVLIFSFQDYWDMLGRDPGQLVRAHSTCHLGSEKNLSEVDSMYAVS